MFKFIKQIAAPSVFAKGLAQYRLGNYEISKSLLLKAGSWMPSLAGDAFYNALLLLIDVKQGAAADEQRIQDVLASLAESPHKDSDDYQLVTSELEKSVDKSGA